MNELPAKLRSRADRKSTKRDEKKRQIAESALEALKKLGYANTSLRDIAAESDLSLGMLHYYFDDKIDLIVFCVTSYKAEFVRNLTAAISGPRSHEALVDSFSSALALSIVRDSSTHRLWYDIRNQAMFDTTFMPVVKEIEASLVGLVEFLLKQLDRNVGGDPRVVYAMLDGLFRHYLEAMARKEAPSIHEMADVFRGVIRDLLKIA